ncbi:MAG: hypothetical protein CMQ24_22060 [Gammaproteobacteria bacterium]|nr:hypothetical protein [Gammaproteobacteria bacterium]
MSEGDFDPLDGFRRSFVVDLDASDVWSAIARPATDTDDALAFHLPGFEANCTGFEVDVSRLLRVRKAEEPCKGTEIVVQLEATDTGTRVTVTQSGFGPWLADLIEPFTQVWHGIVADLKLYIETGVSIRTHLFDEKPPRVALGCATMDAISGVQVTSVEADGYAVAVGIEVGDLLVALNGSRALFGLQLTEMLRLCEPGQTLEATWVRGRKRRRGSGSLPAAAGT